MKNYNQSTKIKSIQWNVLRQHFLASIGTVVTILATLLAISFIITYLTPYEKAVEDLIGLQFYSVGYFILLSLILMIGFISAISYTFYIGYPLGRKLKKNLQSITDGAEAFSRGKMEHRISADYFLETGMVAEQFNRMANRIEKQVSSLQRLVDENARLVNQTKITAALDERRNLARDLHDAVSQQLFAISMTLSALPRLIDTDVEQAKKYFNQVEEMVVNAQQELRALIMHLRPVTLEGHSLIEGMEKLLEELQQKHSQIKWEWKLEEEIQLNQGVEDHLFRVFQEAISNMLRHSKADHFQLNAFKSKGRVFIVIEDNGIGFEVTDKKKSSYGIENMQERVEDVGGRLDIISYPNKGTRIEIRVPLKME